MKEVARIHLKHLDADLTKLTKSQAKYIGVKLMDLIKKMNIDINFFADEA